MAYTRKKRSKYGSAPKKTLKQNQTTTKRNTKQEHRNKTKQRQQRQKTRII